MSAGTPSGQRSPGGAQGRPEIAQRPAGMHVPPGHGMGIPLNSLSQKKPLPRGPVEPTQKSLERQLVWGPHSASDWHEESIGGGGGVGGTSTGKSRNPMPRSADRGSL